MKTVFCINSKINFDNMLMLSINIIYSVKNFRFKTYKSFRRPRFCVSTLYTDCESFTFLALNVLEFEFLTYWNTPDGFATFMTQILFPLPLQSCQCALPVLTNWRLQKNRCKTGKYSKTQSAKIYAVGRTSACSPFGGSFRRSGVEGI